MLYKNVIDLIGNTPLVKLQISDGKTALYAKLEKYNLTGSSKDRIALKMIEDAFKKGFINDDTTIIEPTSGNTGIAIAAICAVKNLKCIIVMPENMSEERKKLIKGYGAELVLTPKEKGMQGAVEKAKELAKEYTNSFIPMQFSNMSNPKAHIETTSKEILEDTDGKVDIVVAGIGTGGTAISIKKGLGDKAKVYGVEPFESPLITNGVAGPHKIQGIGANFITDIYKSGELDGVMTVKGDDAIKEARNLAKTKGIMCGISSGANLYAAKELAKQNPDKLIVTIMCDFGERYLSTELFE